ncbi:MAG TPA: hypothetical protein VKA04_05650 [Pseudodesulfovibrio sp.]|nr:hypothetical protein [Pseudodesulfovibrio sp.]
MARVIVDFTVCCRRDEIYLQHPGFGAPFVQAITDELVSVLGGPPDVVFLNRSEIRPLLEGRVTTLLESGCGDNPDRTWRDCLAGLAEDDRVEFPGEDDLLFIMPFQGVVTRSRLEGFLQEIVAGRITLSSRVTAVNKNPFWLYGIYPEFREEGVVRDVNLTKLPKLGAVHFKEDAKLELPSLSKINGSHDLPKVYELKDSFAHIPASLAGEAMSTPLKDLKVVVPEAGKSKPHLFYMLPILNCYPGVPLSLGRSTGRGT